MTHRRPPFGTRLSTFAAIAFACVMAIPSVSALPSVGPIVTTDPAIPDVLPIHVAPDDLIARPRPPCDHVLGVSMIQGSNDGFSTANGVEPATPRWDLNAYVNSVSTEAHRDYDDSSVNKQFETTITSLPANILSATISITVRPEGDIFGNDGYGIGFDASTSTFSMSKQFSNPTVFGTAWTTATPGVSTFTLNLPLTAALVQKMNVDGFLDVYIQDDTNVDSIILDVTYCECEIPASGTLVQGEIDAFDATVKPAVTPRVPFDTWMNTIGGSRKYDDKLVNKRFGTSFTGLPNHLQSLTVAVHLKGNGELDYNDGIALVFHQTGPAFSWSRPLSTLVNGWATEATVTLNAGTLNSGTVLADINANHWVDVYVQDDTEIDWIQVNYTYCKCVDARTTTLLGGLQDNYANGPEQAVARPQFASAQTTYPFRQFDDAGVVDHQFAYSFVNLPSNILGATLEIRMRPSGGQPDTDYLELQWSTNTNSFVWGRTMNALYGSTWSNSAPATTFTLDLGNLPGASPADKVLTDMNANHYLDIYVADDTDVDYVKLTIQYCACPVVTPPDPTVKDPIRCIEVDLTHLGVPDCVEIPDVPTGPGVPECVGCPVGPTVGVTADTPGGGECGGVARVGIATSAAALYVEESSTTIGSPTFGVLTLPAGTTHAYLESNDEPGAQRAGCDPESEPDTVLL